MLICVCALHCAQQLLTIVHRTDPIILPLTLQTIITAPDVYLTEGNVAMLQITTTTTAVRHRQPLLTTLSRNAYHRQAVQVHELAADSATAAVDASAACCWDSTRLSASSERRNRWRRPLGPVGISVPSADPVHHHQKKNKWSK